MSSLGKRSKKYGVGGEVETDKKIVCSFNPWYYSVSTSVLGIQNSQWRIKLWSVSTNSWVSLLVRLLLRASPKIQSGQYIRVTGPASFKRQSACGSLCKNFSKNELAIVVPLVTSLLESLDFFFAVVFAVDFIYP